MTQERVLWRARGQFVFLSFGNHRINLKHHGSAGGLTCIQKHLRFTLNLNRTQNGPRTKVSLNVTSYALLMGVVLIYSIFMYYGGGTKKKKN